MEKIDEIGNEIDRWSLPKASKRKYSRTQKGLAIGLIIMMIALPVGAGLLQNFWELKATLTIEQAVVVTGGPMTFSGKMKAGCCNVTGPFTATNNGCEEICLDFITYDNTSGTRTTTLPAGITVKAVECLDGEPGPVCYLSKVEVKALDGQAQWDSYDVYVDGQLAGHYTAVDDGGIENWVQSFFDISALHIQADGTHVVKIDCTQGPWTYFNPYGQLGIDYVALYCDPCTTCPSDEILCDSVDIGNPASEANHVMVGWGPIEPATHGGTWGGIANCRATWFYEAVQTDASWATIEMTCDCPTPNGNNHCDCDDPDVATFCLEPGEHLEYCVTYHADIMMPNSGPFKFETVLVPVRA